MRWLLTAVLLGELAVLLDWGSRVFGSYRRSCTGALLRVGLIVCCCAVLAMPALLIHAGVDTAFVRLCLYATAALGLATFVHFLVPYRAGIRRARPTRDVTRSLPGGMVLRQISVPAPGLPTGLESLCCLVVSDVHCRRPADLARLHEAVVALREASWECVFLLGDLADNAQLLPDVIRMLASIESRLGTFCVRGNHDFERGRAELIAREAARNGIRLVGEIPWVTEDGRIEILGDESPWCRSDLPPRVPGRFRIGLTHTPDNVFRMAAAGVDFCAAGHTHAARATLPLLGSFLVPCRYGRFLGRGLFRLGRMRMLVTSGIGYPVERWWRSPEIMSVALERETN